MKMRDELREIRCRMFVYDMVVYRFHGEMGILTQVGNGITGSHIR